MSQIVYTRVLLQHTHYRYLYSLVYYNIPRNTYHSYSRAHFKVLHVPWVAHPDHLSAPHLRSISLDEFASRFLEKPMLWGGTLNFTTHDFDKGPRILNIVMTFFLTPLFHYNTITESRAHFHFSLLDGLSIDFHSHMIVSVIDIYQDIATRDKLIFPLAITCILTHMHIHFPSSPLFSIIGAISKESMRRSAAQLVAKAKRPHQESTLTQ